MKITTYETINGKKTKVVTITVDGVEQVETVRLTSHMVEKYKQCCKDFAHESREWYQIDPYNYYQMNFGGSGWGETSDGGNGIFDVSWAFHKTAKEIEKEARGEFERMIENDLEMLDPGCGEWMQEELNSL